MTSGNMATFSSYCSHMSPCSAISDSCLSDNTIIIFLSRVLAFLLVGVKPAENSRKLLKSGCFTHWDNNIRQK